MAAQGERTPFWPGSALALAAAVKQRERAAKRAANAAGAAPALVAHGPEPPLPPPPGGPPVDGIGFDPGEDVDLGVPEPDPEEEEEVPHWLVEVDEAAEIAAEAPLDL